ncbi:MAG: methylated-DNA--[protein]-cysteine S-methyltransferase [Bacteroidota bacterium]
MKDNYHYKIVAEAIRFISRGYQSQPELEEIAKYVHLSKFHLQRVFQKWVGVSPKQFLQFTTIEHAKRCLLEGRTTLEAAYEVGLTGNGRLHDLFIKIEACTPGEFKNRGGGVQIKFGVVNSPFGNTLIAETEIGICRLSFLKEDEEPESTLRAIFPEANFTNDLGKYGKLVKQYFSNWQIPNQKIVLDLRGTPFQINVWKALLSIPSAQFLAYNDIAKIINKPGAIRAVGTAIGQNPIAYLIPCHRVIRESGDIGNYHWGSERKIAINGFENIRLSSNPVA